MSKLNNLMKSALVGASLFIAPLSANALTVTQADGVTGDPVAGTGLIDVLVGATFDVKFAAGDLASALNFDLVNSNALTAAVTFTVTTIRQCPTLCGFQDIGAPGVAAFIDLNRNIIFDGAPEISVATGESLTTTFTFLIAANSTQFFDFNYGDVFGTATNTPNFDFTVEAALIPVPAAGLLLLTALGGLGLARRKRKAA